MLSSDRKQAEQFLRFLSMSGEPRREVWHGRAIAEGPDKPTDWKKSARNVVRVGFDGLDYFDHANTKGTTPNGPHTRRVPWAAFVAVQHHDPDANSARKDSVRHLRVIALDIDSTDEGWRESLSAVPPHAIVRTKNGYHVYWRLPDAHGLSFEDYRAAAMAIGELCGADPKAMDVARILRVPGYWHQKDPDDPFQILLEKCDIGARVDPFALMERFGVSERFEEIKRELGTKARKARHRKPRESDPADDPRNSDEFEVDSGILPRRVARLRAYVKKVPGMDDGRASTAYALGCKAHDFGVPPEHAVEVIQGWNLRNDPPLAADFVEDRALNAYRYAKDKAFGEDADDLKGADDLLSRLRNKQNQQPEGGETPQLENAQTQDALFSHPPGSSVLPNENTPDCLNPLRVGDAPFPHSGGSDSDPDYSPKVGQIVKLLDATDSEGPLYSLDLGEVEYIGDAVERVKRAFPGGAAILLDAPMGAGKTYSVRQATREGSLIAMTALTALTHANAAKLGAVPYTDPTASTASRVSTTLNSSGKIELLPDEVDPETGHYTRRHAFIDEAHEVADYFHQGPLRERYQTFKTVMRHWAAAKYPIAATANWTPDLQLFFVGRANDVDATRPAVVIKARPLATKRRKIETVSEAVLMQAFFQDVVSHQKGDAPIACAVTSAAKVRQWARMVRKKRPDLRVLEVSSDNSKTQRIQELLHDPNRMAQEFDVLLFSPAVQSGLSIEVPVKRQYVLWNYDKVVARNVTQMCMRCRNLEDSRILLGVSVYAKKEKYPTSRDYLMKLVTRQAREVRGNWNVHLPNYRVVDLKSRLFAPDDLTFTESWILQQQTYRETQNDPFGELYRECKRLGWDFVDSRELEVNEDIAKLLGAQQKEAKEEADLEHAREVAAAEEISDATAKKINEAAVCTPEEKAQLERYWLHRYYDREVDVDMVLRDDRGRHRVKCRRYNQLIAIEESRKAEDRPERLDHFLAYKDFEKSGSRHDAELKSDYRRSLITHHVLRQVLPHAFDEHADNHGVERTGHEIRKTLAPLVAENFRGLQETLGWGTRDESQITAAFNRLCEACGIEVVAGRKKIDGQSVPVYRYDLTTVHVDAKPERDRMRESALAYTVDIFTPRRRMETA